VLLREAERALDELALGAVHLQHRVAARAERAEPRDELSVGAEGNVRVAQVDEEIKIERELDNCAHRIEHYGNHRERAPLHEAARAHLVHVAQVAHVRADGIGCAAVQLQVEVQQIELCRVVGRMDES